MKKDLINQKNKNPNVVLIIDYSNLPIMLSNYSLIGLLDNLDPTRYRAVVVFNRQCDTERKVAERGIRTVIIPHGGGSLLKKVMQYGKLPFDLWILAKKIKPKIIHANNVMAGRPAIALKTLTGLPVIIQIRNIGLWPRTAPFVFLANRFAAVSKATIEGTLPAKFHNRTMVVYDGLDLRNYPLDGSISKEKSRYILGLPTNKMIVGMAGRLTEQKGQKHFIDAAKQILSHRDDVIFIHAGKIPDMNSNDQYERYLYSISTDLRKAGKFIWFDYLECISLFWASLDIAIAPSCGPEAFGLVIIEAMAMQKPVVATMSGGPQEIIESPHSGYLIPMADTGSLSDAINKLLNEPEERRRLGIAGRLRVENYFSSEIFAQRMMDLYDQVIGSNNKS